MHFQLDNSYSQKSPLLLSTLSALLFLVSQIVNFIDCLISFAFRIQFYNNGVYHTWKNVMNSSISLALTIVGYVTIVKLYSKLWARIAFSFIITSFSIVIIYELQMINTQKNMSYLVVRYSINKYPNICRSSI